MSRARAESWAKLRPSLATNPLTEAFDARHAREKLMQRFSNFHVHRRSSSTGSSRGYVLANDRQGKTPRSGHILNAPRRSPHSVDPTSCQEAEPHNVYGREIYLPFHQEVCSSQTITAHTCSTIHSDSPRACCSSFSHGLASRTTMLNHHRIPPQARVLLLQRYTSC